MTRQTLIFLILHIFIINFIHAQTNNVSIKINSGIKVSLLPDTYITIHGSLINEGNVNIKSTMNGDGSLLVSDNMYTNNGGTFEIERYITNNRWHTISSPINNGNSNILSGLWLKRYIENINNWGTYITSANEPLLPGEGYILWANNSPVTVKFIGIANHGVIGPLNLTCQSQGFNLIGNPYTSAIDWNAVSGWTKTNIAPTIYIWNGGNWAIYNANTQIGVPAGVGSRYIALGQGFFVQALPGGGNITMDKQIMVHNPVSFKNETTNQDIIRISVEGNNYKDETVIGFNSFAADTYDYELDAAKFYGSSDAPQIYTKKQENKLAVNFLNNTETVIGKLVYLEVGVDGEYTLQYSKTSESNNILLKDLLTHTIILPGQFYTFISKPHDETARFEFIKQTSNINNMNKHNLVYWVDNNILYINTPKNEVIYNTSVYNLLGSLLFNSDASQLDLSNLSIGMYIAKISTSLQTITIKIEVK